MTEEKALEIASDLAKMFNRKPEMADMGLLNGAVAIREQTARIRELEILVAERTTANQQPVITSLQEANASLGRLLDEKNARIEELGRVAENLHKGYHAQVQTHTSEITLWEARLKDLEKTINHNSRIALDDGSRFKKIIDDKDQKIMELGIEISVLGRKLISTDRDLVAANTTITEKNQIGLDHVSRYGKIIGEKDKRITELQNGAIASNLSWGKIIEVKDATIGDLQASIAGNAKVWDRQVLELTTTIGHRDRQINEMTEKVQAGGGDAAELMLARKNTELITKEKRIQELGDKIAFKDKENDELDNEIAEKNARIKELETRLNNFEKTAMEAAKNPASYILTYDLEIPGKPTVAKSFPCNRISEALFELNRYLGTGNAVVYAFLREQGPLIPIERKLNAARQSYFTVSATKPETKPEAQKKVDPAPTPAAVAFYASGSPNPNSTQLEYITVDQCGLRIKFADRRDLIHIHNFKDVYAIPAAKTHKFVLEGSELAGPIAEINFLKGRVDELAAIGRVKDARIEFMDGDRKAHGEFHVVTWKPGGDDVDTDVHNDRIFDNLADALHYANKLMVDYPKLSSTRVAVYKLGAKVKTEVDVKIEEIVTKKETRKFQIVM